MKGTQANRVIIRVWTPGTCSSFPGNNCGHVSVEIPGNYISLWPGTPFTEAQRTKYRTSGPGGQLCLQYFGERTAHFQATYDDDCLAEGASSPRAAKDGRIVPQITVCLYGLDTVKMQAKFSELTQNTTHWRMIGRNTFVLNVQSAISAISAGTVNIETTAGRQEVDSCVSLAVEILKAGEIGHAVASTQYSSFLSKTSSFVTIESIIPLITAAKEFELLNMPTTKGFHHPDETAIKKLRPPSSCVIL